MVHIRTQIRQAATLLLNTADLGDDVNDSFAPAIQSDGVNISVSTPNVRNTKIGKDAGTPLEGNIALDLVVMQTDKPSTLAGDMDDIEQKASEALEGSTLGGLLEVSFYPSSVTSEFIKLGDSIVAKMTVRYDGAYHTKQSDQSTIY